MPSTTAGRAGTAWWPRNCRTVVVRSSSAMPRGMETAPGTAFRTGTLYAVYSDDGLNGCAIAFQRHLRDRIVTWPKPDRPRPVHYNCWEAVYFDHQIDVLKDIATRAAALGAERFVLDDGWFGQRDDDTSALSDWEVDPRKYPDGLDPLIDHVRQLGMTFGIWFEPEMINPDSDTFRAHPDWALGAEDQIPGRNQQALDMANPEVRDYLFDRIGCDPRRARDRLHQMGPQPRPADAGRGPDARLLHACSTVFAPTSRMSRSKAAPRAAGASTSVS